MRKKKRFKWRGKKERSIAELISADGPLRAETIYAVILRLCVLLDSPDGLVTGRQLICPAGVLIDEYADVRLCERDFTPAETGAYLPPEQNRMDMTSSSARVYALGKLMLYMATGQEKKTEAENSLDNSTLLSLIQRCTAFDPMDRFEDVKALHDAVRRQTRPGRRAIPALLYLVLAAALAAGVFYARRTGGAKGAERGEALGFVPGYAEGYDRGSAAAPGIEIQPVSVNERSGNLSGNYAAENGPEAAYSDRYVFYLLYGDVIRMDAVTGETERLAADVGECSLHYYQGFLYCCTPTQILRIDPETKKQEVLCDSLGGRLYIFDDVLYLYDSAGTRYLYRIAPNGKSLTQLTGAGDYLCLNAAEGRLYYIDPNRGNGICCSETDGSDMRLISSSSYDGFCIFGGKIWVGTDYGLIRMDLTGGSPEIMTSLPAASPNAADGGVFFISGSGRTLEWMSSDGRTRCTVVSTPTSSFQVAGRWILYRNEDDGGRLWRVRISGADNGRAPQ